MESKKVWFFNPWIGQMQPIAWAVVLHRLSGGWYSLPEVIGEMCRVSGVQKVTAKNIIRNSVKNGFISEKGEYRHDGDTRMIRFDDSVPEWVRPGIWMR